MQVPGPTPASPEPSSAAAIDLKDDAVAEAKRDPEALGRLYRRHYDPVFRYAAHRLFDRTQAEELTSQVFLHAVEHLGSFEGSEARFRTWLYTIATHAVTDHFRRTAVRRASVRVAVAPTPPVSQPVDRLIEEEESELLRRSLQDLDHRDQAVIALRYFEGLGSPEIAEILGAREATIRTWIKRALEHLRQAVAKRTRKG